MLLAAVGTQIASDRELSADSTGAHQVIGSTQETDNLARELPVHKDTRREGGRLAGFDVFALHSLLKFAFS